DPSISGRYLDTPTTGILREWASAIKQAGIRRIEGAVIGDDDCFDDTPRAGSWQLDYYADWYAAESSGLTINDNCWDVTIRPGAKLGDPAKIEPMLPTKYVTFKYNVITTGSRGKTTGEESSGKAGEESSVEIERT